MSLLFIKPEILMPVELVTSTRVIDELKELEELLSLYNWFAVERY